MNEARIVANVQLSLLYHLPWGFFCGKLLALPYFPLDSCTDISGSNPPLIMGNGNYKLSILNENQEENIVPKFSKILLFDDKLLSYKKCSITYWYFKCIT